MEWKTTEISISKDYARCFHAAACIGEKVYLHGGLHKYPSNDLPLNSIAVFDSTTSTFSLMKSKNSGPKRSHHAAVALNDRTLCIVGGWDGKKRTADVWLFDIIDCQWKLGKINSHSSTPAGLSNHTCWLTNSGEVVVAGREGGIHMQRRFGSVFKLKINAIKGTYSYDELPHRTSSRAGHTCCAISKSIDSNKASLIVVGGRDSTEADKIPIFSEACNKDLAHLLHKAISKCEKITETKAPTFRNHATLPAADLALVQGGEVFGKARDSIVSDLHIHNNSATKWWKVTLLGNEDSLCRMGHTMAWLKSRICIVGGMQRDKIADTVILIDIRGS